MFHITDSTEKYLFQMIPLMLAFFTIICVTLLCTSKWVAVAIQIPVWVIMFWWWHMQEVYSREPRFRYRREELEELHRERAERNLRDSE